MRRHYLIVATIVGWMGIGALLNVGCTAAIPAAPPPAAPARQAAAPPSRLPAAPPPLLHTQDFDSGAVQMNTVDSLRLEDFLRDLNHRKDYDDQCHDGRPPDADYFVTWIKRVTDELQSRGYYFDAAGGLHRPGELVAQR